MADERNYKASPRRATLAAFALAAMAGARGAERAVVPDTTPCPEAIIDIATCYPAKHETGAYITAALPKTWNADLVVFVHGGPLASRGLLNPMRAVIKPATSSPYHLEDRYWRFKLGLVLGSHPQVT